MEEDFSGILDFLSMWHCECNFCEYISDMCNSV